MTLANAVGQHLGISGRKFCQPSIRSNQHKGIVVNIEYDKTEKEATVYITKLQPTLGDQHSLKTQYKQVLLH